MFRKALPLPGRDAGVKSLDDKLSPPPSPTKPTGSSNGSPHVDADSRIIREGNTHKKMLTPSAVTLFRFSALTFNPHKIHYSLPWARDVEGHRDIVVHGPLNLINILDLWRDTRTPAPSAAVPEAFLPASIAYRATSPLYAGDRYQLVLEDSDGTATAHIFGPSEAVAMKAEIKTSSGAHAVG